MNPKSRSKRILSKLKSYTDLSEGRLDDRVGHALKAAFDHDEHVLGIYDDANGETDFILITDKKLYIVDKALLDWKEIPYSNITKVIIPFQGDDKLLADHLLLEINELTQLPLYVRGGDGKFRDVFEFSRYVDRVIEDLNK